MEYVWIYRAKNTLKSTFMLQKGTNYALIPYSVPMKYNRLQKAANRAQTTALSVLEKLIIVT